MFKSIARLLTGTAFAQILSFIALPFVMPLYSPDEYGVFGVAMVVVGVGAIFSTLQVQQIIVLPKVGSHSLGLLWVGAVGALVGGCVIGGGAYAYMQLFTNYESVEIISGFIGIAVVVTGVSQCLQALVVRYSAFGALALMSGLRAIVAVLFQGGLGYFFHDAASLLASYILSEMISACLIWYFIVPTEDRRRPWGKVVRYWALVRRNWESCLYGALQEGLNSASQGAPVVILGAIYGSSVAGLYSFSTRVLLAPVQLIANAVRQVVVLRFSLLRENLGRLRSDFIRLTIILAIPCLIAAGSISWALPHLYGKFFGQEWVRSGEYAMWLVFWAAMLVANTPSTLVFRVLQLQKVSFYYNATTFIVRCLVLFGAGYLLSDSASIAAFSIAGVVLNVAYVLMALIKLNRVKNGK